MTRYGGTSILHAELRDDREKALMRAFPFNRYGFIKGQGLWPGTQSVRHPPKDSRG